MDDFNSTLQTFLSDPSNHDLLTVIKAIRNGAVYGTKIRFPHALVMTTLFRAGTFREKVRGIFNATRQHASNLALFAFVYKSLTILMRRRGLTAKLQHSQLSTGEASSHPFIAGVAAGYLVFGRSEASRSSVNQQIVIYVFARVVLGLAKLLVVPNEAGRSRFDYQAGYGEVRRGGASVVDSISGLSAERRERLKRVIANNSWAVFASLSWGMVMWLFRWHPDVLQPSLRSSMKYLYENAEKWDGVKNWIWHNT